MNSGATTAAVAMRSMNAIKHPCGMLLPSRACYWVFAILGFAAALRAAAPEPPEKRVKFDIPAGSVVSSFRQFSEQSGTQLLYAVDVVEGVRTNAVKGEFSIREAVNRMLAGTALTAQLTSSGAITVLKKESNDPKAPGATHVPVRRATNPELRPVDDGRVVELSPFVVNTSRDIGYLAENTLAGSRLNTRLRDTPASISIFTPEFIQDLGITDVGDLLKYTVNSELNLDDQVAGYVQNNVINSYNLTRAITTRGMGSSQGLDFFNSITPMDPYRIGRYEDSRGPNSILFGIGSPGGMLNQSSKVAEFHADSASLRYGFGSWDRSRSELDVNRVLRKDKFAASISAMHQENEGWREYDYNDTRRLFGSVTYRPMPHLTFQAMGEIGKERRAAVVTYTPLEEMLAWYDHRQARGVNAVTFKPTTAAPTAAMIALGVVTRNSTATGLNRRIVYIENDGTIFDAAGTYLTGSYNTATVRAPDGTSGTAGTPLRLSDPGFYPFYLNAGGPSMGRDQSLKNYTMSADWRLTENLFLNLAHNNQETTAVVNANVGNHPYLRGEPNLTLGVNGPANPYVGQLYFDGEWSRHFHEGNYKETRLSLSYTINTRSKWLGSHRVAGMASTSELYDHLVVSWLSLAGRPFNSDPSHANNRVWVRNYITEGDYGTYRVGDWKSVPSAIQVGGQTYSTIWANASNTGQNFAGTRETDTLLGVVQSHFWNSRLVSTLGYREDRAKATSYGFGDDRVLGWVVDSDPAKRSVNRFTGKTYTAGIVFHVLDWISLVANRSESVGMPSVNHGTFPDGRLADAPKGQGGDFGLNFALLNGRLDAKIVYFKTNEYGTTGAAGSGQFSPRNLRIMEAFASELVGAGRPFSQSEWDPIFSQYTPQIGGAISDRTSEGYEARLTANITPQWRLVVNYSYTDAGRKNMFKDALPWYGWKPTDRGLVRQGVFVDSSGRLAVNPDAFEPGGTIAKWLELGAMRPAANPAILATSANRTIAQEILELTDFINTQKEEQEKRWGLRPHKISLFTAYDFKDGWLKGLTVGGGGNWRSANVIGSTSTGEEISGRVTTSVDGMLRYALRMRRLPGRVAFQLNVYNLLDRQGIIPQRLSTSVAAPDGFEIPGGRGVGYSRFDLVAPREVRFATTYSF